MSVDIVILLSLCLFVALLLAEIPIAFSLSAGAILGLLLLKDWSYLEATISSVPYTATSKYALLVVPMFVLMGVLASHARITDDLFDVASKVTRRIPGGLGVATVAASAGFAAVTGSSAAAVATVGRMAVGQMRAHGYTARFAAGLVAASGTLGILIPPSIILVVYGILTGESIGELLLAGIVPGLLSAFAFASYIVIRAKVGGKRVIDSAAAKPQAAVEAGGIGRQAESVLYMAILFIVVMGGIYTGFYTATEAASVGAFAALVILVIRSLTRKIGLRQAVAASFREAASITAMIFALVVAGALFSLFLISAQVPKEITAWILDFDVSPDIVVIAIIVLALILGFFLDGFSILLLVIPLSYPIVTDLGYSGIWFAILIVKAIEVGLLTPPFGINVFVVSGVAKDVTVQDAFRGAMPFVVVELVLIATLFAFPEIVMWLPNQMSPAD